MALCFSGDHDHIVCPDKDPDDGFLDDAQCGVRVDFVAFDDHGHDDDYDLHWRHQHDPDHVTGCGGYSHHPDLDTAAPCEVDVHDIVLEVTV